MKIPITVIPIDGSGYHIMVRGTINGLTANILIDTGATRTVLDVKRATHYFDDPPLKPFHKFFAGVGNEKLETQLLLIPEISLQGYLISQLQVVVIDLSAVNQSYAAFDLPRIDMVMGGDLLFNCGAIIDYPAKCMILS